MLHCKNSHFPLSRILFLATPPLHRRAISAPWTLAFPQWLRYRHPSSARKSQNRAFLHRDFERYCQPLSAPADQLVIQTNSLTRFWRASGSFSSCSTSGSTTTSSEEHCLQHSQTAPHSCTSAWKETLLAALFGRWQRNLGTLGRLL